MLAKHYAINLKHLVQMLVSFQMFFDNPIRFILVETWCIQAFAKEAKTLFENCCVILGPNIVGIRLNSHKQCQNQVEKLTRMEQMNKKCRTVDRRQEKLPDRL